MTKKDSSNIVIFEKSPDGQDRFYDIYSRLVKERILFISDTIDEKMGTEISATLLFMDSKNHEAPIKLYVNSHGGHVRSMFSIYDTMNYIKAPVHTYCIGMAYSAASLILSSGKKGNRYAFENADIMVHQLRGGTIGKFSDMENDISHAKRESDRMNKIYMRNTGLSLEKIKEISAKDSYFSADEAKKLGLIDHVISPNKEKIASLSVSKKKTTKK
jgi:ATP-dependent Clp protease protease subunit